MMPSGKAPKSKYSVGGRGTTSGRREVELPSGGICLIRGIQPLDLLESDILDHFDALTSLVQSEIIDPAEGRQPAAKKTPEQAEQDALAEFKKLAANRDQFVQLFSMMDHIVVKVLLEPRVLPAPKPDENGETPERIADALYVDDVDLGDRMAIMSAAMQGVENLKGFR